MSEPTPVVSGPVWIVEDHALLRDTLCEILASEGMTTRGFAACEDALAEWDKKSVVPPSVIVLDINLPGMSGLEGIRRFREREPGVPVMIFTVFDDPEKIFDAICAGASGYLLKSEPPERIVAAVREVREGGSPMTPQVARLVLERFRRLRPVSPEGTLSEREQDVLRLMVDGLAKKEIATRLDLSVHTVDNYVRRIYRKLHVNTLGGAVARALRDGLV
ncbi:MAG: response regulator transcription factor [Verrucomicrobiales bacterium]